MGAIAAVRWPGPELAERGISKLSLFIYRPVNRASVLNEENLGQVGITGLGEVFAKIKTP
jgi:hypothetical protein